MRERYLRDVSYRVRVLRNGAELTKLLWDSSSPPTVMWDKSGVIRSSMKGTFYPNNTVDLLTDVLQPVITVNGQEYPLGVFRASTVGNQNRNYATLINLEAYDRCWTLKNNKIETVLHLAAGTKYTVAVEQLLTDCGIALRIVDPSESTLQTDREDWEIGTDYLSIVNQLLGEINFEPIWFDAEGVAHLERYRPLSERTIMHRYGNMGRVGVFNPAIDDSETETDLFSTPNVFICICSNPELQEPMVATAENDNPSSVTSIFRRGIRISRCYAVDNVASQEELQAYADRLRNESMFTTQTVSFETFAEGGHGIGDTISISDAKIGGVYEETAWSITMQAGRMMKHTAKKEVSTL